MRESISVEVWAPRSRAPWYYKASDARASVELPAARRSGVWRRLGSRSLRVRWDLVGAAVLSGLVAGVLVVLVLV